MIEYLLIDNSRYLVHLPDGGVLRFSPFIQSIEPTQVKGKQVQRPFVDAEIIGFESGEGLGVITDEATGYRTAQGMEPREVSPADPHLRLKVGKQASVVGTA